MNKWETLVIFPKWGIEDFPTDVDYLSYEVPLLISETLDSSDIPTSGRIQLKNYSDEELIQDLLLIFYFFRDDLSKTWLPREMVRAYIYGKMKVLIARYQELNDRAAVSACETAFAIFKAQLV